MAAVFGAAANTPLALSIMAVELLGAAVLPHVALVTVVAYLLTGQRGIYPRSASRGSSTAGRCCAGGAAARAEDRGARALRPQSGASRPRGRRAEQRHPEAHGEQRVEHAQRPQRAQPGLRSISLKKASAAAVKCSRLPTMRGRP